MNPYITPKRCECETCAKKEDEIGPIFGLLILSVIILLSVSVLHILILITDLIFSSLGFTKF